MESKEENMDIQICDVCCETKVNVAEGIGKTFVYDSESNIVCRSCAYELWDRKCVKCGCLFCGHPGEFCPFCEEDNDKEYLGRKATKKDIDALFDKEGIR